ncbi:Heparinase II/III-like family protein [Burkholderiales bacterium]|nr:Heparinase II/III-like family protein [Burkholderiales bacterium]
MSSSLAWRLRRLRAMDGAEVAWRTQQKLKSFAQRWGLGLARRVPTASGRSGRPWVWPLPAIDPASATDLVAGAERLMQGQWSIFSADNLVLGFPPRWNRDPRTGTLAPLHFGKAIDYRDAAQVGDIKYLWELNRHQETVTLAQAYYVTRDWRFAQALRDLLESWFEQCPYPIGVQWNSSLELAVRLVNWAIAWHLIGGEESPVFAGERGQDFRAAWVQSVYRHAHFIAGQRSLHSSANNHLIGEMVGLYVAAVTWPLWPQARRWQQASKRRLEEEALRQTTGDGVDREQAVYYHYTVAWILLVASRFAATRSDDFSAAFLRRLEAMLEFVVALMDVQGRLPMIGDADDAVWIGFARNAADDPVQVLLACGAVLFDRPDFAARVAQFPTGARWLLGAGAAIEFERLNPGDEQAIDQARPTALRALPARRDFPQGGYYILGADLGSAHEVRITADAGPLGYLSLAAHGHADALSFTLGVGGEELLIDPGTYDYHRRPHWRAYFRGTSAHNTVRVDGRDQSESGGSFLWTRHAQVRTLSWTGDARTDRLVAEHDGYLRLDDPLVHRRETVYDKERRLLTVIDSFACKLAHMVEWHWHCGEHAIVSLIGATAVVQGARACLQITMPGCGWDPQVIRGDAVTPLGWVSRRFDEKEPCSVVRFKGSIHGAASFLTHIAIDPNSPGHS